VIIYLVNKKNEKLRYLFNIIDFHKSWQDDAEHVSSAPAVKKFNIKNPRRRIADMLERPVLPHHHTHLTALCPGLPR